MQNKMFKVSGYLWSLRMMNSLQILRWKCCLCLWIEF